MRFVSRALLLGGGCAALLAVLCAVPPAYAQQAASGGTYVVKEGDTLYSIAQAHDLSVEQLRGLNDLEDNTIYPGQELRVRPPEGSETGSGEAESSDPSSPAPQAPPDTSAPRPPAPTDTPFYGAHTAEAGATFYTIAARYGTPVDSLVALNDSLLGAAGPFLSSGATVRLPVSLGPPAHTVKEGETIYEVARRYGVSAKLLQRYNGLEKKEVRVGQHLRIPGREAPQPQPPGTRRPVRQEGPVARYPASYEGRLMAGGARYDPERFVVSHPSLPIGTVVLLTNPEAGRHTFAQVADRGPLDEAFVMDVSAAVHERLGLAEESTQPVEVRVMD